jgi:TRAP transporter TAXI family solute receptor
MMRGRVLVVVLIAVVLAAACGGDGQSRRIVNIVTAPPGGGWYVIGGVIASVINDAVPNVQANAEASGGAEENVRLVGTGQSDLGLVIHKTALQGYRGEAPFNQPMPNLRMLFGNLEVGRLHVVVLPNSPVKDLCELKGKRVAVGPTGNGSLGNLREIFSSGCGFTFDDITPIYLPYDQSLSALGDRRLDAAVLYITPPIPALSEFGAMHEYRLLEISEPIRDAVVKAYPFYLKINIAANSYRPVTQDIPVLGTANGVMVNAELPDDLVYAITKATFENIDRVRSSYPTLGGFSLEVAARAGLIPFHEGAVRYYREQGVWPETTSAEPAAPPAQGTR